jgi:hypothetical protein
MIIPFKNKNDRKEYNKIYQILHKEQIKEYAKRYRSENKEKQKKYMKEYLNNNREKINKQSREWSKIHRKEIRDFRRKHYLNSVRLLKDGRKIYNINKRDYPLDNKCELCNEIPQKKQVLVYHHWNDDNFEQGIWVCHKECHWICEGLDNPEFEKLKNRYLNIKQIINIENRGK